MFVAAFVLFPTLRKALHVDFRGFAPMNQIRTHDLDRRKIGRLTRRFYLLLARSMFGMAKLQLPPQPPKRSQELKQMQRMNEVVKAGGAVQFVRTNGLPSHSFEQRPN